MRDNPAAWPGAARYGGSFQDRRARRGREMPPHPAVSTSFLPADAGIAAPSGL
jgi:hypothetical protein